MSVHRGAAAIVRPREPSRSTCVSLPAGPGLLSFSGGFRLDNSAASVEDPLSLSLSDRVSLGVSDYNAAFGSAQLRIPAGNKA